MLNSKYKVILHIELALGLLLSTINSTLDLDQGIYKNIYSCSSGKTEV